MQAVFSPCFLKVRESSVVAQNSFLLAERKTKQVLLLQKWEVGQISYFGKTSLLQRYQYQKVTALQQAGLPFSDTYLYTLDKWEVGA